MDDVWDARGCQCRSKKASGVGTRTKPCPFSLNESRALVFVSARFLRAFSSEVDTGSREENASKQKPRAWF
jgi:hypothetical protein